jgi:YD repeat-containing protein
LTILLSKETKQPSGLSGITTFSTIYDGNQTHTNSKTQTITTNGKTTTVLNDYNSAEETITTPTGRVIKREYDPNTRLTSKITAGMLTPTTYSYDTKGRVTTIARGSRTVSYTYDTRGNIATIIDPKGNVTTMSYDTMDRVTSISYPNGTTEQFVYDNNGNMTRYTTPRPSVFDFAFDGIDQRVSLKSPLNKTVAYNYNKNRRLTQITKPSGKTITNSYTNDRLTTTTTTEGATSYSYLFANKIGAITKGSEGFSFEYDGELLTKITQIGILNQIIEYSYSSDFKITSSIYAGATQSYSYDNDGLLVSSGDYTITRDATNGYTTQVTDSTLTQNRTYNSYGEITAHSDNIFGYQITNRDSTDLFTRLESRMEHQSPDVAIPMTTEF